MPKSLGQKLKIIAILEILKKYSDEENPLNANDIAKYLEQYNINSERKAIYSDLLSLEEYGYDIVKTTEPKTGWFLGEREFEIPEIRLLCDAVRSVKFISKKKTRELLKKLNGLMSDNQAKQAQNGIYFAATPKSENEGLYYNIDILNRAVLQKKQAVIEYFSRYFDEERNICRATKEMTINPYALCWHDDHYYLIGNHIKYDNLIHLRLDRILKAKITDIPARSFREVSDYTDFFDTADYVEKLFGMFGGVKAIVELCCNKKITEQVIDRFGEDIFITNVTENSFNIKINAALSDALVTWIMHYGEDLCVLSPPELREMVFKKAEKILENYKR